MAGGTRELTNPADMPRAQTLSSDDLIAASRADGTPIALLGSALLGSDADTVSSPEVRSIRVMTQSAYNALSPKQADALYIIVG